MPRCICRRELLTSGYRQLLTVFPNQPRQPQSTHQPWNERRRLRKQSKEPAEIKPVRPVGYCGLVAGDKSERRADAMDRGSIRQIFAQIISELFLCAAANRNDDVCRTILFDKRKKISIFDFRSIQRRNVTTVAIDWKRFSARPFEQFLLGTSG